MRNYLGKKSCFRFHYKLEIFRKKPQKLKHHFVSSFFLLCTDTVLLFPGVIVWFIKACVSLLTAFLAVNPVPSQRTASKSPYFQK